MFNNYKISFIQSSLGPNVYGDLFTESGDTDVVAYVDGSMLSAKKEMIQD
jgi:hypothetical protein